MMIDPTKSQRLLDIKRGWKRISALSGAAAEPRDYSYRNDEGDDDCLDGIALDSNEGCGL